LGRAGGPERRLDIDSGRLDLLDGQLTATSFAPRLVTKLRERRLDWDRAAELTLATGRPHTRREGE